MTPIGILLAAGLGTRFSPAGTADKLLAPLPGHAGLTVAAAAAGRLRAVLPRVVAVVRPGRGALCETLTAAGCKVVISAEAERGMGAALAAAVRAAPSDHGWVVALADMPWVSILTIEAVARAVQRPDSLVAPAFKGQRGHPVGFGSAHRDALLGLDGDEGARALLRERPVQLLAGADAGVLADVDQPTDLLHGR